MGFLLFLLIGFLCLLGPIIYSVIIRPWKLRFHFKKYNGKVLFNQTTSLLGDLKDMSEDKKHNRPIVGHIKFAS